jgi:hypothetical protein
MSVQNSHRTCHRDWWNTDCSMPIRIIKKHSIDKSILSMSMLVARDGLLALHWGSRPANIHRKWYSSIAHLEHFDVSTTNQLRLVKIRTRKYKTVIKDQRCLCQNQLYHPVFILIWDFLLTHISSIYNVILSEKAAGNGVSVPLFQVSGLVKS